MSVLSHLWADVTQPPKCCKVEPPPIAKSLSVKLAAYISITKSLSPLLSLTLSLSLSYLHLYHKLYLYFYLYLCCYLYLPSVRFTEETKHLSGSSLGEKCAFDVRDKLSSSIWTKTAACWIYAMLYWGSSESKTLSSDCKVSLLKCPEIYSDNVKQWDQEEEGTNKERNDNNNKHCDTLKTSSHFVKVWIWVTKCCCTLKYYLAA